MTLIPRQDLLVVSPEMSLSKAIAVANKKKKVVFGVEAEGEFYVIWAEDLITNALERSGNDVTEQLRTLRRLYSSRDPVFKSLRAENLLPQPEPPRSTAVTESYPLIGSDTDVHTENILYNADNKRLDARFQNAFACIYVCESNLHSLPCVAADLPELCPNGKKWKRRWIR